MVERLTSGEIAELRAELDWHEWPRLEVTREWAERLVATLQALQEENAALRQGLEDIAEPIRGMRRQLPPGSTFNGEMAAEFLRDPGWHRSKARDVLNALER